MKLLLALSLLLSTACNAQAQAKIVHPPKPAVGYTVEVYRASRFMKQLYGSKGEVVVCSIIGPGITVGGGDNCDFHAGVDPVYCLFIADSRCGKRAENLVNKCGTSFGCQNLDAFPSAGKLVEAKP